MDRFEGKVALVTGAASGIGRATAVRLAREGAAVVGADLDESGMAQTAALLPEGARWSQVRIDVTAAEQCDAAVQAAVDAFGRLDVLCNIAGIVAMTTVEDTSPDVWDRVMAVNLRGVFLLSRAAVPHLLASGAGSIVNVASNAGLMGQAYTSAYCASKGGVVQLTRALAIEYLKTTLRVNAVAPGGVDTPLAANVAFPEGADWDLVGRYMPPRAMCSPEEVAAAIAFLASGEVPGIHGAVLSIDGGLTAG